MLDQIAAGQEDWQQYVTTWNYDYFLPALERAKKLVVSQPASSAATFMRKGSALSRTQCPRCRSYLAKIPSKKVKKYFLKCISGCEDVVLFWSERDKQWEQPRSKTADGKSAGRPPITITTLP